MKSFASCTSLWLVLSALSGCSALDLDLELPFAASRDAQAQIVDIVCLWEPAEGVGLDGLPTRGFAGQILFFRPGKPEPIRVDGDVWVYVFDDQGTPDEQSRPLHQFEFPSAAWNAFLCKTNLGPAYQLFIPYTRKGVHLANCAIRVRLTAAGRTPVYSKLANVQLPGKQADPDAEGDLTLPVATPDTPPASETTVPDLAAIQKMSAELGAGEQFTQLERLRAAARGAVQTADYVEQIPQSHTVDTAEHTDEPPVSRRYRMSAGQVSE